MKKGLTLTELMIVIVVMAILVAVAIPNIFGNYERTKLSGVSGTLLTYEHAVAEYYLNKGTLPDDPSKVDFHIQDDEDIDYNWTNDNLMITFKNGDCKGKSIITSLILEDINSEALDEPKEEPEAVSRIKDKDEDEPVIYTYNWGTIDEDGNIEYENKCYNKKRTLKDWCEEAAQSAADELAKEKEAEEEDSVPLYEDEGETGNSGNSNDDKDTNPDDGDAGQGNDDKDDSGNNGNGNNNDDENSGNDGDADADGENSGNDSETQYYNSQSGKILIAIRAGNAFDGGACENKLTRLSKGPIVVGGHR